MRKKLPLSHLAWGPTWRWLLPLLALLLSGAAQAQTFSGTLSSSSPTFNRPNANGTSAPTTLSSAATAVYYQSIPVTISTAGTYTFAASTSFDSFGVLYSSAGFSPSSPLTNALQANDDTNGNDFAITQSLSAGTYYLVFTTYSNTATGSFKLTVSNRFVALTASGYTQDVVANGTGTVTSTTTTSFDQEGSASVNNLMTLGFNNNSGSTATVGLPANPVVASEATAGLSFRLGSYSSSNSLRLLNGTTTGTLTLGSAPAATTEVRLLLASGGDAVPTTFTATVNFSDGTSQSFAGLSSPDWVGGTGTVAASNLGRANRPNNTIDNSTNVKLYELTLALALANQVKQVASVGFTRTSTSTLDRLNVLAVSVRVPVTPTLTSLSPNSGLPGTSITLTGTDFLPGSTVSFNGTAATSVTVNSATSITATVPTGTTTGNVTVTTSQGTSNGVVFTITTPTLTSLSPVSGPVGTSVTLTGTNFTSGSTVSFNGTAATSVTVNSATSITAVVPAGATTGNVTVTTAAGTSNGVAFTVSQFVGVAANGYTQDVVADGSGTVAASTTNSFDNENASANYNLAVTGYSAGGTTVTQGLPASGQLSSASTPGLVFQLGPYAGNNSLRLTNSATTGTLTPGSQAATTSLRVLMAAGNGPATFTATVTYAGGATDTFAGNSAPDWTAGSGTTATTGQTRVSRPGNSLYDTAAQLFELTLTPSAANLGKGVTSVAFTKTSTGTAERLNLLALAVQAATVPTLTSLSPNSAIPGASVTLTGTDFLAGSTVSFNGTAATSVTVNSTTSITVVVPTGTTTGNVTVTTSQGTSNGVVFTVAMPTLTSISPASGVAGTSVTLTGTGFVSGSTVSFNGTAATSVTVNSTTSITAVVPTGATTGLVTVANANGTSNGVNFAVTALPILPPTITASGPVTFPSGGSVNLTANRNPAALSFNGTSSYVRSSLDIRPGTIPTLTMEAWVYPTTNAPAEQTVVSQDAGGYSRAIVLTGGNFAVGTGLTTFQSTGATVDLNQWQYIAVVYTPTTVTFYKNGVQTYNGPLSFSNASYTTQFNIGRNPTYGSYFNGYIDEVRVWNQAINVPDYLNRAVPAGTAGVVAYYHLDEGSGTTTADVTGTFPGTVVNAPWVVAAYPTASYAWTPTTGLTPAAGTSQTETAAPAANGVITYTVTTTDTQGNTASAKQNVTVATPGDLVITTGTAASPTSITGGTYNSITVMGTGYAQLVGTTVVNSYISVQNGATFNTNCQSLTGTATFTLAAGGTLGICDAAGISLTGSTGGIQTTGTRSFSTDASYVYNGLQAQTTGSGLPTQVRNLSTTNRNNVSLTAATSVAQTLTVGAAGNLVLNANALTLLSSSAGTALVVNSGTGIVSGATGAMQRYIDASANTGTSGYRHYSSPVSGMTVAGLATSGFTPQVNPAYNTANPNLLTLATYPNVFGYDESKIAASPAVQFSDFDKGYQSPQTTGDALTVGRGYAVQIGNSEKVQFTGTFNTGGQTINGLTYAATGTSGAGNAGWALVGNPYPAPLAWGSVSSSQLSGVDAAAYVFQSTNAYSGRYTSFTNGVGAGTGLIASGQGFFVHTSTPGTTGAISLTNANRVTDYSSQPNFQRQAETRPLLRLSLGLGNAPATAATAQDETFVYFEAGATDGFDGKYDAYKLANPSGYYLGSVTPGASPLGLSIDARSPLAAATLTEIPLWVSLPAGTYTLTATELLNFAGLAGGTQVQLRDALLGTFTDLATTPSHSFAVAANAPYAGRFSLVFRTSTALATQPGTELAQAQASLYPNPAASTTMLRMTNLPTAVASVQVEVLDVLGRAVGHYTLPARAGSAGQPIGVAHLAGSLYLLRLTALDAQGQVLGGLPTQRLTLTH